jgi:L-amino acid N-acyltransferase YncA
VTLIRLARPDHDGEALAGIYRPAVETSAASFETDAPDGATMATRAAAVLERTPWLVAEDEAAVIGYAYAGRFRERPAYRWSVEISAYVHPDARGRGVGRLLYDVLIPLLVRQGFVNAFAGITLPNEPSVRLHEAIGMRQSGVFHRAGYKLGAWHDVAWFEMRLVEPPGAPAEPVPLPELLAAEPELAIAGSTISG